MIFLVGLVIVSHSAEIARGVVDLDRQMAGDIPLFAAGGTDDDSLGTSLEKIQTAILSCDLNEGVVILADVGSSLMTAQSTIDFLEMEGYDTSKIVLSKAALVEASLIASVAISVNQPLDAIVQSLQGYELEK